MLLDIIIKYILSPVIAVLLFSSLTFIECVICYLFREPNESWDEIVDRISLDWKEGPDW